MKKLDCCIHGTSQMDMAVIMTAYQDFDFVSENVSRIHTCFDVYIHVDRKSKVPESFLKKMRELDNVWVESLYRITWGGFQHIKAVLEILELAFSTNRKYKRYIIMSENESSIYTVESLKRFFLVHQDKNYIELGKQGNNGNSYDRIIYFYFQHLYNLRANDLFGRKYSDLWVKFEKALRKLNITHRVKRSYPYKGYIYCSLNKYAVELLFADRQRIIKMLKDIKYFYVGEEYFFQNIFIDTPIFDSIIDNSLVFDDWSKPEHGVPRYIHEEDIHGLKESDKLFFRKIGTSDPGYSKMIRNIYKTELPADR